MNEDLVREYTRKTRVPIYDVGPKHLLKYGTILRYVQESSEEHLGLLHIGYEEMRREAELVFFIISVRVRIARRPTHKEMVTIKTHPCGRGGVQFYRDYKFYDESGSLLIDAMQTSVLANIETRKVQRPQALQQFGAIPDFLVSAAEKLPRLEFKEELPFRGERKVRASDLDSNGHMNNAVYGDVVVDFLPDEVRQREIEEFQITYLNEASLGDVISIHAAEQGETVRMKGVGVKGDSFSSLVRFRKEKTLESTFEK
jgi:medium-chain acyl-[acyl-carrier-protein] hydrolase